MGAHAMTSATMSTATQKTRSGFTLVELLVVIGIVALLFALLLPSVLAAHASARRVSCVNRLRQIGIGLHSYHAALHSFPPGGIELRLWTRPNGRQLAWSAYLLPFVEEQSLYDSLDLETAFDSPVNAAAAATLLSVYVCPSSGRSESLFDERGPSDYGGIYGERIVSAGGTPNGTMLYDRTVSIKQITDGISHTLMISEDAQSTNASPDDCPFADGQWINGRNIFDQASTINQPPCLGNSRFRENDIRSEHIAGANGLFADGAVHFLHEDTDLLTLAAWCTRAGSETHARTR